MLSGMTVVDMSQQLPGPYASALLEQLGAAVTKVEPPTGDPSRRLDPEMFEIVNRGKTCVRIDLKASAGVTQLKELVRDADVFIEGFRPGVAARLGVGHGALSTINPRLVYCSISGVGQQGPFATLPMHDLNLQAMAGADPGPGIGVPWVDLGTGTVAALAVVAAWHRAQTTGTGAFLDTAMLDTAVVWNKVKASAKDRVEPTYGIYPTADGRRIAVAILEDHIWARLCGALGWEDWSSDPALATYAQRVSSAAKIERRLIASCTALTLDDLMHLAREHDLSITPMGDVAEAEIVAQLDSRQFDATMPRMPLPIGSEATR